jgi:putative addiction module component (TIGR02574 family)
MSPTTEHLLNAALALPEGDRLELVEALLASLQPADRPPFDESWRDVIRRRSAELRSGAVVPVPWAEVKRQAREQVAKPFQPE